MRKIPPPTGAFATTHVFLLNITKYYFTVYLCTLVFTIPSEVVSTPNCIFYFCLYQYSIRLISRHFGVLRCLPPGKIILSKKPSTRNNMNTKGILYAHQVSILWYAYRFNLKNVFILLAIFILSYSLYMYSFKYILFTFSVFVLQLIPPPPSLPLLTNSRSPYFISPIGYFT